MPRDASPTEGETGMTCCSGSVELIITARRNRIEWHGHCTAVLVCGTDQVVSSMTAVSRPVVPRCDELASLSVELIPGFCAPIVHPGCHDSTHKKGAASCLGH